MAVDYEKAGVSLEAGYDVVRRIKKHVASTDRLGVMGNIGARRQLAGGAAFRPPFLRRIPISEQRSSDRRPLGKMVGGKGPACFANA